MIGDLNTYANNLKEVYDIEQEIGQYQYLIDIGNKAPSFNENERSEENKMFGCQAQVWIIAESKNGIYNFKGDSDAAIVKGLVEIITKTMSGHSQEEIKNFKHNIVDELGLGPGLTVRRQVGMMAMIDHIKKISGAK